MTKTAARSAALPAAALGAILLLSAGRATAADEPRDEGQAGQTVGERLTRIERLLDRLVNDRGDAAPPRAGSRRPQPFRRPESLPRRELRSTRTAPRAAAGERAAPEGGAGSADNDHDGLILQR